MKVVAIAEERKTKIFEIPKPEPGPGQVLIRIHACALCTFEQRVFTQTTKKALPYVGGHELAGVIEELGEGVDEESFPVGAKIAEPVIIAGVARKICVKAPMQNRQQQQGH